VPACDDALADDTSEGTLMTQPVVSQLRLVVEVEDFDEAVTFYRDVLGLPEELSVAGDGDARVMILEAGRATLELANRAQTELIDAVEVGERCSPKFRVALEVADSPAATDRVVKAGARLLAAPRETPWRSLNARLAAPGDIQLTLFQELEPDEGRPARP
jgi:catechol 2,3-dioxygenase-like lactoylglutathione lyase family enzyme